MYLYFMDEFTNIPVEISVPNNAEEGLTKLVLLMDVVKIAIERKYGIKLLRVRPLRFFNGEKGVVFEYIVKLENGELSAKLITTTSWHTPKDTLIEYYQWERGG